MDDTLAATSGLWRKAEVKLLEAIGQLWSPALAIQYKGMNALDVAATIHRATRPALSVKECQELMRNALFEEFEKGPIEPMPGAIECVRTLAKTYPLAVASGSPLPLIEMTMEILGIKECFKAILSSESVYRGKPFPDIFLAAAKTLGADPVRCLVVEDSLIGTQAARAAGMTCFAVPSSSPKEIVVIATRTFPSLSKIMPEDVASAVS